MLYYTLKRVGYMVLTLWLIATITFTCIHLIPGSPFAGDRRRPDVVAALEARYHLDEPWLTQYGLYLKGLVQGDLGISMTPPFREVGEVIKGRLPPSLELGFYALVYSVVGGVAIGVIASLRHNKLPDRAAMVLSVLGVSVPGFVFATLLQMLFGVQWKKWFGEPLLPPTGWGELKHIILPAFCLGIGTVAAYSRYMRSQMVDVLNQDYIMTAKAKGLSGLEITWRHALRNALLPIVTLLGATVVDTLLGSIVIETIFAIPGIGHYFVTSIMTKDYTMVMGTSIFYATLMIVALFLVDIAYGFVDPRIRITKAKA